jgi:hypothetical protein
VLQVSSTQPVWSAWDSLWKQVQVPAEGVPVVLQIVRLAKSARDLVARFVHCFNPAEHPLEVFDELSQSFHLLRFTNQCNNRRNRESPGCWRSCCDLTTTHPAIRVVGGDSVLNRGARHVIAVCANRIRVLGDASDLHPG